MFNTKYFAVAAAIVAVPLAPLAAATMSASSYVMKAGASDLYERTSSEIVLQSTQNQQIRDYAQMMITDHTKSTDDVKQAAMQDRVRVAPPKLEPMQARMVAQLRAANGEARDRLYLQQQRMSHQAALTTHQNYAASGRTPALKMAASMIVPVVQHHIDMLQSM